MSLRAATLLENLVAAGHPGFRYFLAQAYEDAGNALARLGEREHVVAHMRRATGVYENLAAEDPGYRDLLARASKALGELLAGLGDLAGALEAYERAVDLCRALLGEGHGAVRADLRRALTAAATTRGRAGDTAGSLPLAREAIGLADLAVLVDAGDGTDVPPDLGQALRLMAVTSSGDEAYDAAERAAACYRRLDRETPGTWRRALVLTLVLLARRAAQTERWRVVADAAEETIADLLENAPDDERAGQVLPELLDDYRTAIVRLNIPDTRLAYAEAALRRLTWPPATIPG
ncbi:hypothetical protein AB0O28_37275 [Microbispora sp. NPDC088329]|uniref:tetratricopeptide repeat protein n=1 Tax=Microbispora sp. NPDC088329 TaxID=3154869 RepID=UPI0034410366